MLNRNQMIVLGVTAAALYAAYRFSDNRMLQGVATVVAGLVVAKQVPVLNQAAA